VVGVLARDEQVGFAYKVSLRIEFLPYILISKFYQLEILDDIINILRKPVDIETVINIGILWILLQPRKIILRRIVKFSFYATADEGRWGQIIDLIIPRLDHTIQPPQNHKRQDHIPLLMRLEQAPQHIISQTPIQRRQFLELRHSEVFICLALWSCKFKKFGYNIKIS